MKADRAFSDHKDTGVLLMVRYSNYAIIWGLGDYKIKQEQLCNLKTCSFWGKAGVPSEVSSHSIHMHIEMHEQPAGSMYAKSSLTSAYTKLD